MMVTKAMVLAAGLGTRMRPLTLTTAKPLIPIAGKPMLEGVLDHLRMSGIDEVVVNTHYLADQVEACCQSYQTTHPQMLLHISYEPELLETAGSVINALPILGTEPFIVVNSDMVWREQGELLLRRMMAAWRDDMDMLLALIPTAKANGHERSGDVDMTPDGQIIWGRPEREAGMVWPYVYIGIQMLHPRLLAAYPLAKLGFPQVWNEAVDAKGLLPRIYGIIHQGMWCEVGTPQGVEMAERMMGDQLILPV
jgi:MurNAc alpha-1-phosphate uridylyltransferase